MSGLGLEIRSLKCNSCLHHNNLDIANVFLVVNNKIPIKGLGERLAH